MYYPFPKPLGELDFDDVQEFLRQAVPENLYLDYKQEFKAQKLAKSIASFANTKGGIVIIGVHENKDTKLPESWDGIDEDGTISEQINAVIANVEPYPICNFAVIKHAAPGKIMVILIKLIVKTCLH